MVSWSEVDKWKKDHIPQSMTAEQRKMYREMFKERGDENGTTWVHLPLIDVIIPLPCIVINRRNGRSACTLDSYQGDSYHVQTSHQCYHTQQIAEAVVAGDLVLTSFYPERDLDCHGWWDL